MLSWRTVLLGEADMKSTGFAMSLIILLGAFRTAWCEGMAEPGKMPPQKRPTVIEARGQARVVHATVHALLQSVHHRYYREDEGLPLPAAVFRDVFREIEKEQNVQLRWLAVEGAAMNTDHLPRDAFEKEAVKSLLSGRNEVEQVEPAATGSRRRLRCRITA